MENDLQILALNIEAAKDQAEWKATVRKTRPAHANICLFVYLCGVFKMIRDIKSKLMSLLTL